MNSRPLMLLRLTTAAIQEIGKLSMFPVTGGSFEGERLRGKVLAGGGDWVVAWGGDHWVTEMTESGAPVLSLKFPGRNCYRVDPVPPGRLSAASLRAAMDRMHPRKGRT